MTLGEPAAGGFVAKSATTASIEAAVGVLLFGVAALSSARIGPRLSSARSWLVSVGQVGGALPVPVYSETPNTTWPASLVTTPFVGSTSAERIAWSRVTPP